MFSIVWFFNAICVIPDFLNFCLIYLLMVMFLEILWGNNTEKNMILMLYRLCGLTLSPKQSWSPSSVLMPGAYAIPSKNWCGRASPVLPAPNPIRASIGLLKILSGSSSCKASSNFPEPSLISWFSLLFINFFTPLFYIQSRVFFRTFIRLL